MKKSMKINFDIKVILKYVILISFLMIMTNWKFQGLRKTTISYLDISFIGINTKHIL